MSDLSLLCNDTYLISDCQAAPTDLVRTKAFSVRWFRRLPGSSLEPNFRLTLPHLSQTFHLTWRTRIDTLLGIRSVLLLLDCLSTQAK